MHSTTINGYNRIHSATMSNDNFYFNFTSPSQMFVEHDESHEHRVGHYAQADQRECNRCFGLSLRVALKRSAAISHGPVRSGTPEVGYANHHRL